MRFYGREDEIQYLKDYVGTPKSELMYVRGWRRVGKSLLLQQFKTKVPNCFYFSGTIDSSDEKLREDFVESWNQFIQDFSLSELKKSVLTWDRVFKEITKRASSEKNPLILIFDEIQWIAKTGSGFIGKIKEAWLEWEQSRRIKVILCGSSSKFFDTHVGGEEKALRGLSTCAALWVKPFRLSEVQKYYLQDWSLEEIGLTYMMLGGIPYYLERLDPDLGFVHAINEAIFTSKSIFLDEMDEILTLEFNSGGKKNVHEILSVLGQGGKTQKLIVEQAGLGQSTVSGLLEKLIQYQILFEKYPAHASSQKHQAGIRYYMKDFFMNFYFQILHPLRNKIKKNTSALLFPCETFRSRKGFYIENFSGKAFELLVAFLLESRSLKENIFKKLLLKDPDYSIGTYWDETTQIDLIVEHPQDRLSRVLECKWVTGTRPALSWIEEVNRKKYDPSLPLKRKNYLIVSQKVKPSYVEKSKKAGVSVIELADLFE